MFGEVFDLIKTKEDLVSLMEEVDLLLDSLYEESGSVYDETIQTKVRARTATIVTDAIEKSKIRKKDYLQKLSDELGKLKVLKLTVSLNLAQQNINSIYKWVYANIGEKIVLDLRKDETIGAGAVISFGGKYGDFSASKAFREAIEAKREEIKGFLRA